MNDFWQLYLTGAIAIWAYVTTVWLMSLALRDASIIDIFWGLGFVVLAVLWYFLADGAPPRRTVVVVLVSIWGMRLSLYLLARNWGREEDYRYQDLRNKFTSPFWLSSYFIVFLVQGLLILVISVPLLAAQTADTPAHLTWLDYFGIVLWCIGFFFEVVGDWQLMRFKAQPENRGKLLATGLWRYTRHPNYFGDATLWWGYFCIAAATGAWWTVFGPVVMTILLLKVSGVSLLEKNLKKSKPEYADYIRRTSAFIPMPPKTFPS